MKKGNKLIITGKTWGGETNLREREYEWISTGKNRVWGPI